MKRRRRASSPSFVFWSKQDQRRFIDGLERFAALVNDLERILTPAKRRRQAKDAAAAAGGDGKDGQK
jgi:hypothetical protein